MKYVLQADTPRLGKAGAAVEMTEKAARYLVMSGQLVSEAEHKALAAKALADKAGTPEAPAKPGRGK